MFEIVNSTKVLLADVFTYEKAYCCRTIFSMMLCFIGSFMCKCVLGQGIFKRNGSYFVLTPLLDLSKTLIL